MIVGGQATIDDVRRLELYASLDMEEVPRVNFFGPRIMQKLTEPWLRRFASIHGLSSNDLSGAIKYTLM